MTFVPPDGRRRGSSTRWPRPAPGGIGDYERCAWTADGHRHVPPLAGARPGGRASVGRRRAGRRDAGRDGAARRPPCGRGRRALRAAHPYEEPAFDVLELAPWPGARGLGRVGPPGRAGDARATSPARSRPALPADRRRGAGRRRPGPAGRARSRSAAGRATTCSTRSGRAGADAYVTADLRHHPASEALEHGGPGAGRRARTGPREWPWLADCRAAAARGPGARPGGADTVETRVSHARDRPVDAHLPSPTTEEPALKAAAADQQRLLDVQALDTRLDQLAHRRAHPARARRARRARSEQDVAARPARRRARPRRATSTAS